MNQVKSIFAMMVCLVMFAAPKDKQEKTLSECIPGLKNQVSNEEFLTQNINEESKRLFTCNPQGKAFSTIGMFDYRDPIKVSKGGILMVEYDDLLLPTPSQIEDFTMFLSGMPYNPNMPKLRVFGCLQEFRPNTLIKATLFFSDAFLLPGAFAFMKTLELIREIISNINSSSPDPINPEAQALIDSLHAPAKGRMPNGLAFSILTKESDIVHCVLFPCSEIGNDRFSIMFKINIDKLAFLNSFLSGAFFGDESLCRIFNPEV